ncbi:hypothetical protein JCM10213_001446 [Rhodosporidiobolus nylandii]
MSNSDKFQQDEAIVADSNEPQLAGVLDGADAGEKADVVDDADDQLDSTGEYDGVSKDNIIDNGGLLSEVGQRGVKEPENYGSADAKADDLVERVTEDMNDGTSRIAQ